MLLNARQTPFNKILSFQQLSRKNNQKPSTSVTSTTFKAELGTIKVKQENNNNLANKCKEAECGQEFFNVQGLFKHQLQSNHYDKYCYLCDKSFCQRDNLRRHFGSLHSNIRYQCWMCKKMFNRPDKMKEHQWKVHKAAACKYCQAAFREKGQLQQHIGQCAQKS